MVRLVLFDVDGTLIRTGGAGVRAFGKVFSTEFGAPEGSAGLSFAGRTDISLVREFFSLHRIPATPENFTRFFERYAFWLDHLLAEGRIEICAGVWEFLASLQALSPPPLAGLLTGNIRLGAEIKLRRAGMWHFFETGAFADDHEDRNQIAAIARERGSRMLRETLRPEQVLVVGDTPLDIRCARAIQARVLAVATGGATLEQLQGHQPDWAVSDLRCVTVAEVTGNGVCP
jgi:phosphoglycolate phosphatase-like HAD superfamily hydrolase